MDQYIGKFLDNRYEILERIGSGGMAVVYKAKCHWLNRFVAVKILKEDLAQDEEFRHRFHEESQAVAMLSHPNIVSVYDVSRQPELDYIVMELIEGITLKQYMQKRGGKLSWKESLHFISQIMKALSHAHGRGIIHRDIKPHNIMVLRDGSVKVADFGIARLMSAAQNTMTQEALGSVHYISPEQARGSRVDARSDIYSAGVVLYEMLTGRLPYEGDSPVAVAIQHINSIPLSPRELDPSIPEALEEITMKAMASNIDKRYASANDMLADLEEFRKNPNISFDYTDADLLVGEDEPTRPVQPVSAEGTKPQPAREESAPRRRSRPEPVEEEYDEDDGGGKRVLVVIVAALLCLVGVGAFLWNTVFSGMFTAGETFEVPDLVTGVYTLEEAQALPAVTELGFTVEEGQYIVSDTVPAGRIVSQSPAAGEQVKVGNKTITVTISSGNGGLTVPDVFNKDRRVAESILRAAGLEVTFEEAHSSQITKDNIISQSPEANVEAAEGDTVTLVVSLGPDVKQVPMIDVTRMTLTDATEAITKLNLRVGEVKPVSSEEYAEGLVCYQSVPLNTSIPEGTVINLQVSTGPDITKPPEATESAEPQPTSTPASDRPRTKSGTVDLPNDRESVTVRVTVGGVEQRNDPVDTRMRVYRFNVEGTGLQEILVFIDDVQVKSYIEDFTS